MITPKALDFHTHLRQGELMRAVCPTLDQGGTQLALVMPNTQPPITTADMAVNYRNDLVKENSGILYLMTLYLTPTLTVEELNLAKEKGVVGVKYYPHGLTTNSQHGMNASNGFKPVYHLLEAMEKLGIVLNIHGEVASDHENDICVMNAEVHFLKHLRQIHSDFPKLKIVLEHVTTREAVECVMELGDSVAATITVHHLDLIVDDWAGRPHHYCKPVAKYPHDRLALRNAILSKNPKFFLGSDSAPHYKHRKEAAECCAGVYTSAYLLQVLAHLLQSFGALDQLESFTFSNGFNFYKEQIKRAFECQKSVKSVDLKQLEATLRQNSIDLKMIPMDIPKEVPVIESDGSKVYLVPFMAGKKVNFSL